jgi:predicted amidohydrolase
LLYVLALNFIGIIKLEKNKECTPIQKVISLGLYYRIPNCYHIPRVIIEDGVCKLADRSALAGSVATMDRLIRTLVQKAEIPLEDAVRMASETPSKFMGVYDRKGSLQKGKDADILILDQDLNIRAVWAMGKLVEGTYTL